MPAVNVHVEHPVEVPVDIPVDDAPVNIRFYGGALSVKMKPSSFKLWISAVAMNRGLIESESRRIKRVGSKFYIQNLQEYVPLTIYDLLELNDTYISTEYMEDVSDDYESDDTVYQLGVLLNTFVSLIES